MYFLTYLLAIKIRIFKARGQLISSNGITLGLKKMSFANEIILAGRSSYEFHWAKHVNSHYPCQRMCRMARVCFRPWRRGDNMICPNDSYLTSMHNNLNIKGSWSYKIRAQLNTDTHMPDGYFRKTALSKWKNYNMDNNPRIHVQNPLKMPRV